MSNDELIAIAEKVIRHKTVGDRMFGDVAAALITDHGHVFTGVAVDTPSWGLCAERSAIAAMVTAGEYRIQTIVAVWKPDPAVDPRGTLHVLPPCGLCRQFIRDVDEGNRETEVILGRDKVVKAKELLPYSDWPEPLDDPA